MLKALDAFKLGKLVALPTETVYGLSAPYDHEILIKKIFEVKKRPFFDPLIVHISSLDEAKSLVENWGELEQKLANLFWPGPLTLVLKKNNKINDLITAGLPTVGIRMPAHAMAQEFLKKLGKPVVAPSANMFGKTSPTCAEHVGKEFSEQDVFILDGGNCAIGIESTIVKVENGQLYLLRKGMITKQEIEEKMGIVVRENKNNKIETAGQLEFHYQPRIPLCYVPVGHDLDSYISLVREKLRRPFTQGYELKLSSSAILAARELYTKLRSFYGEEGNYIFFCETKEQIRDPLWEAILERLEKAACYKN
ncbi:MAG: threonylcarbamoyl-AMP synthase [Bacteriovoracaceae bacterium]|nr:threonylcarbamoyl-AMP synthase [Bacteriovoracaceae bacterium]